jgi:hypothetical protein
MRTSNERGMAMITTLLVMMLMSALLVGFTAVVMSDQRYRVIDRDRGQAFYGASGGMEKLTTDLGTLFFTNVAPTATQVSALATATPTIPGITFANSSAPTPLPASILTTYYCGPSPKATTIKGTNGYTIMYCTDASGNPITTSTSPIKTGPYEGLIAQQTPYQLDVTARSTSGGEVHLVRTIESVSIPVFQFGMFSDVDLSFFAGPDFDFGGRVHTNGNLFLAEGKDNHLYLREKVTAVKEVVRKYLSNGVSIATSDHTGTVFMAKGPGCAPPLTTSPCRPLETGEGSVTEGLWPVVANEPEWHTTSETDYNLWIRNSKTGAKKLDLPLITAGGANPDLGRRPLVNEDTLNPVLFGERYFPRVSLRILLSDKSTEITNLPTVTATAPILLDGNWNTTAPTGYTVDTANGRPPIALSPGYQEAVTTGNTTAGDTTVPAGVPTYFRPVTLTVNQAIPWTTTCTGRASSSGTSNNQFTGCNPTPVVSVASGTTISASINGQTVSTTLNGSWSGSTMKVQDGGTAAFAPGVFWLNNSLVSCAGSTTTAFTQCRGVPNSNTGAKITTATHSDAGTGLIGGYIKIEVQTAPGAWTDVTAQVLSYGIGGPNTDVDGTICGDPSPKAILRIQRLKDNAGGTATSNGGGCNYAGDTTGFKNPMNWWPNVLFDTREALQRDTSPGTSNVILGGVMHYIALDVANLSKWFTCAAPYNVGACSGNLALTSNGYSVFFSDRRNNRDAANKETAEYGWEDFVNPANADGAANNTLDAGEDVNASGALEDYGRLPSYDGVANSVPSGASAPLTATARPWTQVTPPQAMVNRAILFRRALKLVNGGIVGGVRQIVSPGLTIVTENPVYIQGNFNASDSGFDSTTDVAQHVATSIVADAVTLLSGNWNDNNSFSSPYNPGGRTRTTAFYRVAIIAGKGPSFPQPSGTADDFGTDGGAHNFLRYLEGGGDPLEVNYRGSIAMFFYNRQAVGTYKCCNTVYGPPLRKYSFDIDFLTPSKLPPLTPVFRDMNTVGFSQDLRPGK